MKTPTLGLRNVLRRLIAPALGSGKALARDERGVTAIEFGILALPFFAIIFAIMETTLIFFAGQILDSAVSDASRLIRTGRAQGASWTANDFRNEVCDHLYGIFECANLKIKVSVVNNFTAANLPPPTEEGDDCDPICEWTIVQSYTPGVGGDVVLAEAYYKWQSIVHLPIFDLRNQPDGMRLLAGIRVFKNEPF